MTNWWLFPPRTREVQLDEKWAFVGKKEEHCDPTDPADAKQGDHWDHVALDAEHRLVLSVVPVKAQLWMYAVPLLGQQLSLMRLLRAEPLAGVALALSALATLLAALGLFLLARRAYESEQLAVSG